MTTRCPRCNGWLYREPDLRAGRWLTCLCCGWQFLLGPGLPSGKRRYRPPQGRLTHAHVEVDEPWL